MLQTKLKPKLLREPQPFFLQPLFLDNGKEQTHLGQRTPCADPRYGAGVARALGIKMEDAMNEDAK